MDCVPGTQSTVGGSGEKSFWGHFSVKIDEGLKSPSARGQGGRMDFVLGTKSTVGRMVDLLIWSKSIVGRSGEKAFWGQFSVKNDEGLKSPSARGRGGRMDCVLGTESIVGRMVDLLIWSKSIVGRVGEKAFWGQFSVKIDEGLKSPSARGGGGEMDCVLGLGLHRPCPSI